ncbi:carboxypeptidase M32 [Marinivivus vitaminiproducens]|uniref:carboxypeptidase M32 n=1 Tax=Marinivivus vitaminiproducens TaxID=3035935 RepID=UPI00279F31BD|nr:carboxypeptidase M32 [Geminicoccaceae bacterium SCSIO 64248]
MTDAYSRLEARFARLSALEGAGAVLHWDFATMMPEGGAATRGLQMAELQVIAHEILTAPETGALIHEASEADGLDPWQAANLAEMQRHFLQATAVPADLVAAESKASSACEMVWREARERADFALILPSLAEMVRIGREVAQAKGEALGLDPYAALMAGYEPGLTPALVDALFAPLIAELPGLLDAVLERQARLGPPIRPAGMFPIPQQQALARRLMTRLGFDFRHGRLDESHHPFCGGVAEDIRITTRYDTVDPTSALMAVLHETGHALYEAGRPLAWRGQPVGEARGMLVHESQSLLVEMQACRSSAFLAYLGPVLAEAFGRVEPAFAPGNLTRLYTHVERGFIRVDADEVTYPLHVILRYRLEQDLIAGRLAVADLPEAWSAQMRELLGITPPDDAKGCLQDVHWPAGAFGYFPCYTLGAMTAAQLFQAARAALPALDGDLAAGEFTALLGWLRANVHELGSSRLGLDIVEAATGRPLGADAFLGHLNARYLAD